MRIFQITLSFSLILLFAAVASAKIVFSAYQDREYHIYVMNDDGGNITQLTDYPHKEIKPRWSPDGKQIAFLRDTDPSSSLRLNTFIMNADGTNVRQVTNYQGSDRGLAFSPDGKKLLVSSMPNTSGPMTGLHIIDIKSGDTQKISNIRTGDVDWSPDGKQILFVNINFDVTEDNIWIMNADGTDARPWIPPIRVPRTMDREMPRWSPDGQHILYTEIDIDVVETKRENGGLRIRTSAAGTYRYRIRNLNGGVPRTLGIPKDWAPYSVAWMKGRRYVLFCALADSKQPARERWLQLYKYNTTSGNITQLTHDPSSKWSVDWISDQAYAVSPAGKYPVLWGELKKAYSDTQ